MLKLNSLAIVSLFALLGLSAQAQEKSVQLISAKMQEKVFPIAEDSCGLQRAVLLDYHNIIAAASAYKGGYYTTHSVGMVLETNHPSCIRQYGIVQFVKGCGYHLSQNRKTGKLIRFFDERRDLRAQETRPTFLDWTVDSSLITPLMLGVNNAEGTAERGIEDYRIPRARLRLDAKNPDAGMKAAYETLFTATNPKTKFSSSLRQQPNTQSTQIFTSQQSPGSTYLPSGYRDTRDVMIPSFVYKTCVYRMKDIPSNGDPANFNTPVEQGGPLHCFDWNDNMRIDPATGEMGAGNGIDPFCTGAEAIQDLKEVKTEIEEKSIWNFPTKP